MATFIEQPESDATARLTETFCARLAERAGAELIILSSRGLRDAEAQTAGRVVLVWLEPEGCPTTPDDELLAAIVQRANITVVVLRSAGPLQELERRLSVAGLKPFTVGLSPATVGAAPRPIAIVPGPAWSVGARPPSSFRVIAIMVAYNEADIVRASIEHLVASGIQVYLLDNWSTDGTATAVQHLLGRGLLAIETFPDDGPPRTYQWTRLLGRVEELAQILEADWFVHHDVDERREGPWPVVNLREALHLADRAGFNAVDHTLIDFLPTDDKFVPGTDFVGHLHYCRLGSPDNLHVKAWKNLHAPVDLRSTGGHEARFEGRRVFPLNFSLRHYPIRSERHGRKKVFCDRLPRYESEEVRRGWHDHYQRLAFWHRFIQHREDLELFEAPGYYQAHLLELLGRVGVPRSRPGPAKAAVLRFLRRHGLLQPALAARRVVLSTLNSTIRRTPEGG